MEATFWITVGGIALLMILSAFFSGSETALTAVSRPRMHELERQGNSRAAIVNQLLARKENLIGALLIGNNAVNIGASALATAVLIQIFGDTGVVYATVVMTVLILILSEVTPKTYAITRPDHVALAVAPLVRFVVVVLTPITLAVQFVAIGALRLIGARVDAHRSFVISEDELRGAIELHKGPDPEAREEQRMLRSVLDLGDVEVGEIATHRSKVEMINGDLPPAEFVRKVLASPYTRIPVWRGEPDNIVGVVHAKAVFRALQNDLGNVDKLDIARCISPPWFIPESTTLLDQLSEFQRRQEHIAIVVDEYGSYLGIVTLEDILEEIVGQIEDEHDDKVAGVTQQPDGSYLVDGTVTIRDLNREFDWRLPDDEASTIAGLVMHEARRIPEVGQQFAFHGFRFEIVRRRKNRILAIRMSPLESAEATPDQVAK
ncbi:MAG TPA: HlyC/CorC family transporter [Alphaproteobacteria bacterium]|jgi:Mg2+/Co2+ transporter CorB